MPPLLPGLCSALLLLCDPAKAIRLGAATGSAIPHHASAVQLGHFSQRATSARAAIGGLDERSVARLQIVATTMLWGTYATSMKLTYAAEGAELTPLAATTIRFAIMAVAAQLVLAFHCPGR